MLPLNKGQMYKYLLSGGLSASEDKPFDKPAPLVLTGADDISGTLAAGFITAAGEDGGRSGFGDVFSCLTDDRFPDEVESLSPLL